MDDVERQRERAQRELDRYLRGSDAELRAAVESGEFTRLHDLAHGARIPSQTLPAPGPRELRRAHA